MWGDQRLAGAPCGYGESRRDYLLEAVCCGRLGTCHQSRLVPSRNCGLDFTLDCAAAKCVRAVNTDCFVFEDWSGGMTGSGWVCTGPSHHMSAAKYMRSSW
jgi:hypothetical protein